MPLSFVICPLRFLHTKKNASNKSGGFICIWWYLTNSRAVTCHYLSSQIHRQKGLESQRRSTKYSRMKNGFRCFVHSSPESTWIILIPNPISWTTESDSEIRNPELLISTCLKGMSMQIRPRSLIFRYLLVKSLDQSCTRIQCHSYSLRICPMTSTLLDKAKA